MSQNSESSGYVTHSNAKLNGSGDAGAINGIGKDKNDNKVEMPNPSSSSLKCLEDPTFSFDDPKSSSLSSKSLPVDDSSKKAEVKAESSQAPKKPSYRVLEDPDLTPVPSPRSGASKVPDPMTTSIYQPKQ